MELSRSQAIDMMFSGSLRDNDDILGDLSSRAHSVEQMTYWLCEFVTRRPLLVWSPQINRNSRFIKFKNKYGSSIHAGFLKHILSMALTRDTFCYKILVLFEQDYGNILETFTYMADLRGMNGVAYFPKLVRHLSRMAQRPEWLTRPETMFDGSFLKQLQLFVDSGESVKEISGLTNTILDYYEWAFSNEYKDLCGFGPVKQSQYDICYDLGGGLTTPYLSERFDKNFICLDIIAPNQRPPQEIQKAQKLYNDLHLSFNVESVPFKKFDVHEDRYSRDYQKYLIVSFGFLGSMPGNVTNDLFPASFQTIYSAVHGISELILAGKDLTLCVYGRPSGEKFMNVCYTFRFKNARFSSVKAITHDCYYDKRLIALTSFKSHPDSPYVYENHQAEMDT